MSRAGIIAASRRKFEADLTDACTIRRRSSGGTTDPDTGYPTIVYGPDPYSGPCRIQQHQATADRQDVGEDNLLLLRLEVQLPVLASVGLEVGDEVTVTAAVNDPDLIGRVFVIHDLAHASEKTSRRVQCTERTS